LTIYDPYRQGAAVEIWLPCELEMPMLEYSHATASVAPASVATDTTTWTGGN
jgi:hypothetical protein